jgi:hypothetical protein
VEQTPNKIDAAVDTSAIFGTVSSSIGGTPLAGWRVYLNPSAGVPVRLAFRSTQSLTGESK